MGGYQELHCHTHFSTLDGLNTSAEYMLRAAELGMTHLASTDHGTIAAHRQHQLAAAAAGITPVLGVEAYYSITDRFDKRATATRQDGTSVYNHIIILAQNENGLKNLSAISEKAWTEGFYIKPRCDFELLSEYNQDLIVLSGCLSGPISKAIEANDMDTALGRARKFKDLFGDRFYIEVQSENPKGINEGLLAVADKLGIKPVITGDCHYADPKDRWLEEAFLILSANPKPNKSADFSKSQKMDIFERLNYLYPDRRMTFEHWDLFLAGREHREAKMQANGFYREDIYDNTNEIASRIGDYPFYEGLDTLPVPKRDAATLLREKCREGMISRKLDGKPEYEKRLSEELTIIQGKKFDPYFLIEADIIQWSKSNGIFVGPGRGSGAGSLVNYVLHVTDVDPIVFDLPFWRFVDPGRDDYPDIDTDFMDSRRHEVMAYAAKKWKNVARIATFTEFDGKAVVKAAARVFMIPFADVNKIVSQLPDKNAWDEYLTSPRTEDFRKKYPEVTDLAGRLIGRISQTGMHAAGLVISNQPIFNYVSVETRKDDNDEISGRTRVIGMDMRDAEKVGFIKFDILGLKTLSVIKDTLDAIKERHNIDIDLLSLPLDDKKTYEMISAGYNKGVFQAEGHTFNKWILETGADKFNDLVIGTSIARPGPLNTVGEIYKRRRAGVEAVTYKHPLVKKFTEETLGCIVYQEQVMKCMIELGGMSISTAHKVRKIIGKKLDVKLFEPHKIEFVAGASKFVSVEIAEQLWHDFEAHAGYSFVKAHAVAYSLLTYWTAWLKCHYSLEFMYAALKNQKKKESITEYLMEAKRLGVTIKLPDVNTSQLGFSIQDGTIRFGLTGIKYVAESTANRIISARPFSSFAHLKEVATTKGSGISARVVSVLDYVGAAVFEDNPRRKDHRDYFYEYLNIPAFTQADLPPIVKNQFVDLDSYEDKGCFLVMGMAKSIIRKPGWARIDLMDETGSAGIFADEHTAMQPGEMYVCLVSDNRIARYMTVSELLDNSSNVLSEYVFASSFPDLTDDHMRIIAFSKYITRAGKKMAYIVGALEDKTLVRFMAFPTMYTKAFARCFEGAVICPELGKTDDGSLYLKDFV